MIKEKFYLLFGMLVLFATVNISVSTYAEDTDLQATLSNESDTLSTYEFLALDEPTAEDFMRLVLQDQFYYNKLSDKEKKRYLEMQAFNLRTSKYPQEPIISEKKTKTEVTTTDTESKSNIRIDAVLPYSLVIITLGILTLLYISHKNKDMRSSKKSFGFKAIIPTIEKKKDNKEKESIENKQVNNKELILRNYIYIAIKQKNSKEKILSYFSKKGYKTKDIEKNYDDLIKIHKSKNSRLSSKIKESIKKL